MVSRVFGRADNALGRRGDLLVGGAVGEDHDLVEKVRSFRTLEESSAPGLREEKEAAWEAHTGGAHTEEWSE